MSKLLEWHSCPHCKIDKYCSPAVWRDHVEDCAYKANKHRDPCPRCRADLMPVFGGKICSNDACDYQLRIFPRGGGTQ